MKFTELPLAGCYELEPNVFQDSRGKFSKIFNEELFLRNGFRPNFREQYFSVSRHGVLRGMHFQLPPYEHDKLVCCLDGKVFDAIVDLRVGSPTYGEHFTCELDSGRANMLYISAGFAHGFYTQSKTATMLYNVTSVYSATHDAGIRWDSAGIQWPGEITVISERDRQFISFSDFNSPFIYRASVAPR